MKKRLNTDKIIFNKFVFLAILLFFVIIIYRMFILSVSSKVDGIDIQAFASNRNTRKDTIFAQRGALYDKDGELLAQTINSYTVIAFLDPGRSEGFKTPRHVVDKEKTAEKLSEIINMSKESILLLLNKNAYQVELGPGGRGITELTKSKITDLNIPGISFISTYKRYYPNGDFLSYVLGYVQTKDSGEMLGEMGIESYYNGVLKGENGHFEYQQDLNGYKIPNTPEIKKESVEGVDIYLTIDSNIQFFAEKLTKEAAKNYSPEWIVTVVADAKTGAILASTSTPSFDPNIKNIDNYLNPLVSYSFEPGSTMKTYTYMATMEKGVYNGNEKFLSGVTSFGGENVIYDWVPKGWGSITYDVGYALSANSGVSNLTKKYINGPELRTYYEKLGFGSKTGITLPGELSGALNFNYPIEVANASFGQGILTTPIQNIKALTAISNDGVLLKPYIIKKIVNSSTGNIEFEGSKEELGKVASASTIKKIKQLMHDTVNLTPDISTGYAYKIDGFDIIGKTGTAQYTNETSGEYYFDGVSYIRSFAGMFPKDNPEVIIYVAMKKPYGGNTGVINIVKPLIKDIANYKGMFKEQEESTEISSFNVPNMLNKKITEVNSILEKKTENIIIIGDGDEVISQYPKANTSVTTLDKIFIITNSKELNIPKLLGWSLKDVITLSNLLNIELEYTGTGFVYEQDISEKKIIVKLKSDIVDDLVKEDIT